MALLIRNSLIESLIQAFLRPLYSSFNSLQFCFGYFYFIAKEVFWAVKIKKKETQSMRNTMKATMIVLMNLAFLVKCLFSQIISVGSLAYLTSISDPKNVL